MQSHNAIVVVSRQLSMSRSNANEPFAALTWDDLDKLSAAVVHDLLVSAAKVSDCDVLFYRKPDEPPDEFLNPLRKKVKFCEVQGASFTEELRGAVEQTFAAHYRRIVVVLEHHPLITPRFFNRVFDRLTYEDDCFVVGPTVDGRCFLVGMKSNHADLFIPAAAGPIEKSDILFRRCCGKDAVLFPMLPRTMLNSGHNLARLRDDLERSSPEEGYMPKRTLDVLKKMEKKYKVKHPVR